MLALNATRPVLIGRLAIYAADVETAREAYDVIVPEMPSRRFGTVTLESGEEIDWVDMARGVVPPCELRHEES